MSTTYFVSAATYGEEKKGFASMNIEWSGPENAAMLGHFADKITSMLEKEEDEDDGPYTIVILFFRRLEP